MAAKYYRIKMTFTYVNGLKGGILDYQVYGKKAIQRQLDANRQWLKAKGHKEEDVTITEI
jgi:hypothetical protein